MTTESTDEAIQDTSEELAPTTSQNLFGEDFNLTPGELAATAIKVKEGNVPEEKPKQVQPEVKTEEPSTDKVENEEAKYLPLEDFGSYLIKTKVGDEEKEVEFKDVLRSYQTDKYLTQKGQQLAEQFRELEKAKDTLVAKSKTEVTAGTEEDSYTTDYPEATDPKIEAAHEKRPI